MDSWETLAVRTEERKIFTEDNEANERIYSLGNGEGLRGEPRRCLRYLL
jgi:hypothetical protein